MNLSGKILILALLTSCCAVTPAGNPGACPESRAPSAKEYQTPEAGLPGEQKEQGGAGQARIPVEQVDQQCQDTEPDGDFLDRCSRRVSNCIEENETCIISIYTCLGILELLGL
ncbi:MAG: hypothetical protein KDK39_20120 [Leptospiraceae bacterium]|nr:hypothetical protein [Leptospiraceae bacterium]